MTSIMTVLRPSWSDKVKTITITEVNNFAEDFEFLVLIYVYYIGIWHRIDRSDDSHLGEP